MLFQCCLWLTCMAWPSNLFSNSSMVAMFTTSHVFPRPRLYCRHLPMSSLQSSSRFLDYRKIIKKNVLPRLQTPSMKVLLKLPLISTRIFEKIKEHLVEAFGGNFYEIIVGGAAFNSEVEDLLKRIGFPYTVGYGATECAPIITYEDWQNFKQGSCGKATPRMEVKINSSDPQNEVAEIYARGANVMLVLQKRRSYTCHSRQRRMVSYRRLGRD
mgnify:CR=1 FL=1